MKEYIEIIKDLQEADATLNADGYKSCCQVRLAIADAIRVLEQAEESEAKLTGTPEECGHGTN